MRSRLGLDTREEAVDEDAISLGSILPPNNDDIESAAESLDPGINPPGGNGGGGGGSLALAWMSDESLFWLVSCCMIGCWTVSATNLQAEMKRINLKISTNMMFLNYT